MVTFIAKEQGIDHDRLSSKAALSDDKCPGFRQNELDALLHDLKCHFSDTPGLCSAGTCKNELAHGAAVVNLPPRQIPAGITDAVRNEIEKLLKEGVIVVSS